MSADASSAPCVAGTCGSINRYVGGQAGFLDFALDPAYVSEPENVATFTSKFFRSCFHGFEDDIGRYMTHYGQTVETRDDLNRTALHWASASTCERAPRILQRLIVSGADVTAEDRLGFTPLFCSIVYDSSANTMALLQAGADVRHRDVVGRSAIHWAACQNRVEVLRLVFSIPALGPAVREVMEQVDGSGRTVVHYAAGNGYAEAIDMLLQVNSNLADFRDSRGRSPLHYVANSEHGDAVQVLINHHASVNIRDDSSCTPLHYAAYGGYFDAAKRLIENDAQVNAVNNRGRSALHFAVGEGQLEVAKLLLRHRANIDATDCSLVSVLVWAAEQGQSEIMSFLLEQGANPLLAQEGGQVCIHRAASMRSPNPLRAMLDYGCDPEVADNSGLRAVHYAAFSGSMECVKLLMERKASMLSRDTFGRTCIFWAIQAGHLDMVKCLVYECKVPVNTVDSNNLTPMDLARMSNQEDIYEAMEGLGALTHATIQDRAASMIQRQFRAFVMQKRMRSFRHVTTKAYLTQKHDEIRGFVRHSSSDQSGLSGRLERMIESIKDPKSRVRERVSIEDDEYGWKNIVTEFVPAGGGTDDKQIFTHPYPSVVRVDYGTLEGSLRASVLEKASWLAAVIVGVGKTINGCLVNGISSSRFQKLWLRPKAMVYRTIANIDAFVDDNYEMLEGTYSRSYFLALTYEVERLYSESLDMSTFRQMKKESSMLSSVHALLCASYNRICELMSWIMCRLSCILKECNALVLGDEGVERMMNAHALLQVIAQRLHVEVEALSVDISRKVTAVSTAKLLIGRSIATVTLICGFAGIHDEHSQFEEVKQALWDSISIGRSLVTQLENTLKNVVTGEFSIFELCPSICRLEELFRVVEFYAAVRTGMEEEEAASALDLATEAFNDMMNAEKERVVTRAARASGITLAIGEGDSTMFLHDGLGEVGDSDAAGEEEDASLEEEDEEEEELINIPDFSIDNIRPIPRIMLAGVLAQREDAAVDPATIDPYADYTYVRRLMDAVAAMMDIVLSEDMSVSATCVLKDGGSEFKEQCGFVRALLNSMMLIVGEFIEPQASSHETAVKNHFSEASTHLLQFKARMSELLDHRLLVLEKIEVRPADELRTVADREAMERSLLGVPAGDILVKSRNREEVIVACAGMSAAAILRMFGADMYTRVYRRVWSTAADRVDEYRGDKELTSVLHLMGGHRSGRKGVTPRGGYEKSAGVEHTFNERMIAAIGLMNSKLSMRQQEREGKVMVGYLVPRASLMRRTCRARARVRRRHFRGPMYATHEPIIDVVREEVEIPEEELPDFIELEDSGSDFDSDPASDDEAGRERLARRRSIKKKNAEIKLVRDAIEDRRNQALQSARMLKRTTGYKPVGYAVRMAYERQARMRCWGSMTYEVMPSGATEPVGDFANATGGRFERARVADYLWRERTRPMHKMSQTVAASGEVSDESDWGEDTVEAPEEEIVPQAEAKPVRRRRPKRIQSGELVHIEDMVAKSSSKGARWLQNLLARQYRADDRILVRRLCGVIVMMSIAMAEMMCDAVAYMAAGLTSNCIVSRTTVKGARTRIATIMDERAHDSVLLCIDALVERTVYEHGRLRDTRFRAVIPTPWMEIPVIADKVTVLHGIARDCVDTTTGLVPQEKGLARGVAATSNIARRVLFKSRKILAGIPYHDVSNQLVHPDASDRLIVEGCNLVAILTRLGKIAVIDYEVCLAAIREASSSSDRRMLPKLKKMKGKKGKKAKVKAQDSSDEEDASTLKDEKDDNDKRGKRASALDGEPAGAKLTRTERDALQSGRLASVVSDMDENTPMAGTHRYSTMVDAIVALGEHVAPVTEELAMVHSRGLLLLRTLARGALPRAVGTTIEFVAPMCRHVGARDVCHRMVSVIRRIILSIIQYGTVCGFLTQRVAEAAIDSRAALDAFSMCFRDVTGGFIGKRVEKIFSAENAAMMAAEQRGDICYAAPTARRSDIKQMPPPPHLRAAGARNHVSGDRRSETEKALSVPISMAPGVPGFFEYREAVRHLVPVPPKSAPQAPPVRSRDSNGMECNLEMQEVTSIKKVRVRPTIAMVAAMKGKRKKPPPPFRGKRRPSQPTNCTKKKKCSPFAVPVAPRERAARFIPRRAPAYDVDDW